MKKLLSIALLTAIIICASACTKNLSPVSSAPTCVFPPPNTSAPLEVPPTTEATTKPDESEKEKDAAFSAYLEQLQSHSDWFTERYYYTAGETKPIAVYDVDGNGIPELLYVHPAEDQSHGEVHFSIYTYANESLQKLYEDYIFSLAGAEPGCFWRNPKEEAHPIRKASSITKTARSHPKRSSSPSQKPSETARQPY